MRVLATAGFSFAAGLFLTLLPWDGWQLYAAGVLALVSLLWALLGRRSAHFRRGLLILLPLTVSLLYFTAYRPCPPAGADPLRRRERLLRCRL